jgi:hypothetical protein
MVAAVALMLLAVPTLVVFPLGLPLPVIVIAQMLQGIGASTFDVVWLTQLQHKVPDQLISRVSSIDWLGSVMLRPVGTAVAGPLAMIFGIKAVLWASAALLASSCALALLSSQVRQLRDDALEPESAGVAARA